MLVTNGQWKHHRERLTGAMQRLVLGNVERTKKQYQKGGAVESGAGETKCNTFTTGGTEVHTVELSVVDGLHGSLGY
jgi:hypothetical protein